jgi:peptidoglycan/xylan/chitin deacetylase (PgdA/CDA1 family)
VGSDSLAIHFTFDDGPDAIETPKVLECLERYGISATFFLLGKAIARNEQLVRRIANAGHTLGNHSFSHPRFSPWNYRSPANELAECQCAIYGTCGIEPRIARPPFGRCTPGYLIAARRQKLRVQTWTLDSGDWQCRSENDANQCAREVSAAMQPGDTILFHDNHRWIVPILEAMFIE